jgi:citrate synthase
VIIKGFAREWSAKTGREEDFAYLNSVERNGIELITERKDLSIPICANVDLYSGLVIRTLGIPDELFTPLFAISRISGWCAHRIEEVVSSKRIMRPAYRAAVKALPYIPLEERE